MKLDAVSRWRNAATGFRVFAGTGLIGAMVVVASPVAAASAQCATVGSQVTCTFSYNGTNGSDGTPQPFVVPDGVRSVTIEAWGAEGGPNYLGGTPTSRGGHVKGTLPVTPGQTLTVRVGGQPQSTTGGYNGGGNGGPLVTATAGGGASDIRQGGDTLANRDHRRRRRWR